jgi:prolyl oligopeptidase
MLSTFLRCTAAALVCAATGSNLAQSQPPMAPIKDVTDTYFGATVHDPYRYFEDMKDAEVAAWMKAQADYARATLDKIPQRNLLLKDITRFGDAAEARVTAVQIIGARAYYLKRKSNENIPKLYVRDGFRGKERLLFDPGKVAAPAGKHYAIDYYQPSPDNKYVAFGISIGGSEESVLHVLDVRTGKQTGDVIDRANYAQPSWLPDGRLMYSRLQKLAPGAPVTDKYQYQKTYLHKLGANPDSDPALLGAGVSPAVSVEPAELVFAANPIGSSYVVGLVVNGVQNEFKLYAAPLAAMNGDKTPWVKIADTADDVTDLAVIGDTLYLLTHKDASRFKVLRLSLAKADLTTAEVVVPESEAVITGIASAKDALYLRRMNGGISDLLRLDYAPGAKAVQLALPFGGNIDALATDPRLPGVVFDTGA